MANWNNIKQSVQSAIKTNGNNEITGILLQQILKSIIDSVGANATFAGIAKPSTNPGIVEGGTFYIAFTQGLYSNFGITLDEDEVAILYKLDASSSWQKSIGFTLLSSFTALKDRMFIAENEIPINKSNILHVLDILTHTKTITGEFARGLIKENGAGIKEHSGFQYGTYEVKPDTSYKIVAPSGVYTSPSFSVISEWHDDTFIKDVLISPCASRIKTAFTTSKTTNKILVSSPVSVDELAFDEVVFKNEYDAAINDIQNQFFLLEAKKINLETEGAAELATQLYEIPNKYVDGGNGKVLTPSTQYSDWVLYLIPVLPGETYSIKCTTYSSANFALFLMQSLTTRAAIGYCNGYNGMYQFTKYPDDNEFGYKEITIPEGIRYIACNAKLSGNFGAATWSIRKGTEVDKEPRVKSINGYSVGLSSEQLNSLIDKIPTPFAELNIVIMGDSITWQGGDDCNGRTTPSEGWTTYFKQIVKPKTIRSYARSGATWSHTAKTVYDIVENTGSLSDNNVIYNQINRLISAVNSGAQAIPDLIIVAAGTNDAWFPSGRPYATSKTAQEAFETTSGYITSKEVSTLTDIATAIRYDIELIKTNYPKCQVIILTPLQSTSITNERISLVGGIIEQCANFLSCCVVRQDRECGLYRATENVNRLYTLDGTHTSALGAQNNGKLIASRIKAMLRGKIE